MAVTIRKKLLNHFLGNEKSPFLQPSMEGFFERNSSYGEAVSLLKGLRLNKDEEEAFLSKLKVLQAGGKNNGAPLFGTQGLYALLVLKASESVFGETHLAFDPQLKEKTFIASKII